MATSLTDIKYGVRDILILVQGILGEPFLAYTYGAFWYQLYTQIEHAHEQRHQIRELLGDRPEKAEECRHRVNDVANNDHDAGGNRSPTE